MISGTNYTKIKDVPVGDNPVDLDSTGYTVHVANSGSDTISAINSANYTKIKDVPVEPGLGHTPVHLITQHGTGLLVLDATANASLFTHDGSLERLGDIPVGRLPLDAAAEDEWNGAVYVANYMSGTVSAIDFDKKKVSEIPVGVNPKPIAINQDKRIVYVANVGNLTASDISTKNGTVSAIYIPTNKVVSGVAFNIVPFHGGHVKCNTEFPNNQFYNVEAPTNQYFYTGFGTNCIAEPSKGFQFSSWVENLEHNSSRTIKTSPISDSPFDPLLRFIHILRITRQYWPCYRLECKMKGFGGVEGLLIQKNLDYLL